MGLFDWLFGNRPKEPEKKNEGWFKLLNGYGEKMDEMMTESVKFLRSLEA